MAVFTLLYVALLLVRSRAAMYCSCVSAELSGSCLPIGQMQQLVCTGLSLLVWHPGQTVCARVFKPWASVSYVYANFWLARALASINKDIHN